MCPEIAKKIWVVPHHRESGKGWGSSLERYNCGDFKALLRDAGVTPSKSRGRAADSKKIAPGNRRRNDDPYQMT